MCRFQAVMGIAEGEIEVRDGNALWEVSVKVAQRER
jgi:hypothetical protein